MLEARSLPAGRYVLTASTFEPAKELGFELRVSSSSAPLGVAPLPHEAAGLRRQLLKGGWSRAAGTAAGSPNHGEFHRNPQYRLTLSRPAEVSWELPRLRVGRRGGLAHVSCAAAPVTALPPPCSPPPSSLLPPHLFPPPSSLLRCAALHLAVHRHPPVRLLRCCCGSAAPTTCALGSAPRCSSPSSHTRAGWTPTPRASRTHAPPRAAESTVTPQGERSCRAPRSRRACTCACPRPSTSGMGRLSSLCAHRRVRCASRWCPAESRHHVHFKFKRPSDYVYDLLIYAPDYLPPSASARAEGG